MSLARRCDGCGRPVADDDPGALRDLLVEPGAPPLDWCSDCVAIIRLELPRLVTQAREARRAAAAEPVRSRALTLWKGGPVRTLPKLRA